MQELKNKLHDAKKRGLRSGAKGLPPENAAAPDENEIFYNVEAAKLYGQKTKGLIEKHTKIRVDISNVDDEIASINSSLEALPPIADIDGKLHVMLSNEKLNLEKIIVKYKMAIAELKAFKMENGITRQAHYPKDKHTHLSSIILILVLEAMVGSYFYSQGVGFAKGAFIAFIFSMINVVLAIYIGMGLTFKNSKKLPSIIIGWLSLAIGLPLLILICSIIATFRAILEKNRELETEVINKSEIFKEAIEKATSIFQLEIPFSEMNGYLLFCTAVIASIYAIYKGYWYSDPIPGYERIDRRAEENSELYNLKEKNIRGLLMQVKNEQQKLRNQIISNIGSIGNKITSNISELEKIDGHFKSLSLELRSDHRLLIKTYRESVAAVHPTSTPLFFKEDPYLELDQMIESRKDTMEKIISIKEKFTSLKDLILEKMKDQNNEIDQKVANLSKVVDEYLAEIDAKSIETIKSTTKIAGPLID